MLHPDIIDEMKKPNPFGSPARIVAYNVSDDSGAGSGSEQSDASVEVTKVELAKPRRTVKTETTGKLPLPLSQNASVRITSRVTPAVHTAWNPPPNRFFSPQWVPRFHAVAHNPHPWWNQWYVPPLHRPVTEPAMMGRGTPVGTWIVPNAASAFVRPGCEGTTQPNQYGHNPYY